MLVLLRLCVSTRNYLSTKIRKPSFARVNRQLLTVEDVNDENEATRQRYDIPQ